MTRPQRSAAERSGRCSAGLREVTWSGPCDKSETLDPCTTPLMKLLPADPRPTTRMCSGLWNPPMLQIASAANHDAPWAHRNVNLKRRSPCRDSRLSPNDISRCGFRRPRFSWSAWHPHQRTRPAHHHHHSHGAPVVAPNQSESGSHRLVRRFAGLLVHWFAGSLVCWFTGLLVWFAGRVPWSRPGDRWKSSESQIISCQLSTPSGHLKPLFCNPVLANPLRAGC